MKPLSLLISILLVLGSVPPVFAEDPDPAKDRPKPSEPEKPAPDARPRGTRQGQPGPENAAEPLASMTAEQRAAHLRGLLRSDPSKAEDILRRLQARLAQGGSLKKEEVDSYRALAEQLRLRIAELKGGDAADSSLKTLLGLQQRLAEMGEAAKQDGLLEGPGLEQERQEEGASGAQTPIGQGAQQTRANVGRIAVSVGAPEEKGPQSPGGVSVQQERLGGFYDGSGLPPPPGSGGPGGGLLTTARKGLAAEPASVAKERAARAAVPRVQNPIKSLSPEEPAAPVVQEQRAGGKPAPDPLQGIKSWLGETWGAWTGFARKAAASLQKPAGLKPPEPERKFPEKFSAAELKALAKERSLPGGAVPTLLRTARQGGEEAKAALALLRKAGSDVGKEAVPELLAALKSDNGDLRALSSLLLTGSLAAELRPEDTLAIVEGLKSNWAGTRLSAIETLAALGPRAKPALEALIRAMPSPPSPELRDSFDRNDASALRAAIFRALDRMGPLQAEDLPAVFRLVAASNEPELAEARASEAAVSLLAKSPAAAEFLRKAAMSDDWGSRDKAFSALWEMREKSAPILASILEKGDAGARYRAAQQLGASFRLDRIPALGEADARKAASGLRELLKAAKSSQEEDVVRALSALGPHAKPVVPELAALILRGDARSSEASKLLVDLDAKEAGRLALESFSDKDPAKRSRALGLLAESSDKGEKLAVPETALLELLRDRYSVSTGGRQLDAARLLLRQHPQHTAEALDRLRSVMSVPNPGFRRETLQALGSAPPSKETAETIAWAMQAYGGGDPKLRVVGAQALARMASAGKVDGLTERLAGFLQDKDKEVRAAGVQGLANSLGADPKALAALTGALSEADPATRQRILKELEGAKAPPDSLLPGLAAFLTGSGSNDPAVLADRARVLALADRLAQGNPARDLFPALLAPQAGVRALASDSLKALVVGKDAAKAVARLQRSLDGPEGSAQERLLAVHVLAALGDGQPKAVEALLKPSLWGDKEIQSLAQRRLAELGPKAVPALAKALAEPGGSGHAKTLWEAGPEGRQALIKFVQDSSVPLSDRTMAVFRLDLDNVSSRDPKAAAALVPVLKEGLLGQVNPFQAASMARALGRLGIPEAAAALEEGLKDKSAMVRYQSALSLARAGDSLDKALPVLVEAARMQPGTDRTLQDVRREALSLLNSSAGERDLEPVFAQAKGNPDKLWTLASQNAGVIRQRALGLLSEALSSQDPRVRADAARILGNVGYKDDLLADDKEGKVLAGLLKAAKDPDPEVRRQAASSLASPSFRSNETVAALAEALKDKDPKVREAVVGRLSWWMGPKTAQLDVRPVIQALADIVGDPSSDAETRKGAVSTLGLMAGGLGEGVRELGKEKLSWAQGNLEALRKARPALAAMAESKDYNDRAAMELRRYAGPASDSVRKAVEILEASKKDLPPLAAAESLPKEPAALAAELAAAKDPSRFALVASAMAKLDPQALKELAPRLEKLLAGGFGEVKDEKERSRMTSALMNLAADADPEILSRLAQAAVKEMPPAAPAGLGEAVRKAAEAMLDPTRWADWRKAASEDLAARQKAGDIRWFRETEYADADGAKHRGFASQGANGAWRFEGMDGFYAMLAPDGSKAVGNSLTGAFKREDPAAKSVYDPLNGSFERTPKGRDFPDIWWGSGGAFTGVQGQFLGHNFNRPQGEVPRLKDGKLYFHGKDAQGREELKGWMEPGEGGKVRRFDVLPGGLGFVEDGRSISIMPHALSAIAEGRLDLSGIPEHLLPAEYREAFQKLLRTAPAQFKDLGEAFRGDVEPVQRDGSPYERRSSVQALNIYYDDKDNTYRMQLLAGQRTVHAQDERTRAVYDQRQTTLFAERLPDGQVRMYRSDISGGRQTGLSAYVYDRDFGRMTTQVPDEDYLKKGMTRFRPKETWQLNDGRWAMTSDTGLKVDKGSWWDGPKWVGGKLGQGVEIVFSPFQTALYSILAGASSLQGYGGTALGYEDFGALSHAQAHYTFSQGKLVEWTDAGWWSRGKEDYDRRTYDGLMSTLNPRQKNLVETYLRGQHDEQMRKRLGETYFMVRGAQATSADLHAAGAGEFGASNVPKKYMEWGDESWKRGGASGYTGAALNYGAATVFGVGEAYVEGFGFGLVAAPLKGAGAAGKVMKVVEPVAMLTPAAIGMADSWMNTLAALRDGKRELALEHFHDAYQQTSTFAGLSLANRTKAYLEGKGQAPVLDPKDPQARVLLAAQALDLKPEQIAGKTPAETAKAIGEQYQARARAAWASRKPGPEGDAAAKAEILKIKEARALLLQALWEPQALAPKPQVDTRPSELRTEQQGRAPRPVEDPVARPSGKPMTEGRPPRAAELLVELGSTLENISKLGKGHPDLPALRERHKAILAELKATLEGGSTMTSPPEVRAPKAGEAPPKVLIEGEPQWVGRPDLVRETLQTAIAGRLLGGGRFKFYESAQGIEGYFQPEGSTDLISVSFKDLRGAKKIGSLVSELNQNANKIESGVLSGQLPPETLGRVFAHVRAEMTSAQLAEAAKGGALGRMAAEGIYDTVVLQGTDGLVVIGKGGVKVLPFSEPAVAGPAKSPDSGPGASQGRAPGVEARLTDFLFGKGKGPGPAQPAPGGPALPEQGAARLLSEAGAAFDKAGGRHVDLWFDKDGSLLSVGAKPASGGVQVRVEGYRLGGETLVLQTPKAEALEAFSPEARSALTRALRSFSDQQMIRAQFESARKRSPQLGEADLAEMQTLARMMREAGLPNEPVVDRIFYDSIGKGSPGQGIKLRVSDYRPAPGETRAQVTEGRKAVLEAFLEAAKDPELAKLFDFKVTLAMDAMTGEQAGKFVTIYSKDPASALKLAKALDGFLAQRGIRNGALPPEDFGFGESGMLAWRFGRFTQGALEAPDGRGGMRMQADSRTDPVANLHFAKEIPGMAPWLELAAADPRWKPVPGAQGQGRAPAAAPAGRAPEAAEAWPDIKGQGPQRLADTPSSSFRIGGEKGARLEVVTRAEYERRYPELARRLGDPTVEHLIIDPEDPARLKGLRKGETVELGRETEAGKRFQFPDSVSRKGLVRVSRTEQGLFIEDQGATNGTRLQPAVPKEAPPAQDARLQGLVDQAKSWLGLKTPEERARVAALKDAEAARLVFADKVLELWLTDASDPRSAAFRSSLEGVIGKEAVADMAAKLRSGDLPSRLPANPAEARDVKGTFAVHRHDGRGGAADILFNYETLQGNPGLWRVALSLHERVHNSLAAQGQRGEIAAVEAEVLAFDTFMRELQARGIRPDLRPDKPGQPPYTPSAHELQMAELAEMIRRGDGAHIDLIQAAYDARHGKGYTAKDPYDGRRLAQNDAAHEARLLEAMRLVEAGKAQRLVDLVRGNGAAVGDLKPGELMPADLDYYARNSGKLGTARQIEQGLQARARAGIEVPGARAQGRAEASLASLLKLVGVKMPAVDYLGQGSAGVAFKVQRPGEEPVMVKVGKNPLGTRRSEAFLGEHETIDRVYKDYSKAPVPGFEVMKPVHAEFSFAERAAIRDAAARHGIPASLASEMVQNGLMVTTELVPGETIQAYLARGGTLSPAERRTVSAGLQRLNDGGWVATDVSPKNLMVRELPGGGKVFTLIDTGGMEWHRAGTPEYTNALRTQAGYLDLTFKP